MLGQRRENDGMDKDERGEGVISMDDEKWKEVKQDFEALDEEMEARLIGHIMTERFSQLGNLLFGVCMKTQFGPCLVIVSDEKKHWFPCNGRGTERLLTPIERDMLRMLHLLERENDVVLKLASGEVTAPATKDNILALRHAIIQGWTMAQVKYKLGLLKNEKFEKKEERLCSTDCPHFKVCEDIGTLSQPGALCTKFKDGRTAYEVAMEGLKELPPAVRAYVEDREGFSPPEEHGG